MTPNEAMALLDKHSAGTNYRRDQTWEEWMILAVLDAAGGERRLRQRRTEGDGGSHQFPLGKPIVFLEPTGDRLYQRWNRELRDQQNNDQRYWQNSRKGERRQHDYGRGSMIVGKP